VNGPELQLARVEGARLLRNPAVWLSLSFTVIWARQVDPAASPEDVYFLLSGFSLVLPGFVMLAIIVLAALRSRSSGADALLDTVPVGPDRRSIAHGLSALAGAIAGVVVIAAGYVRFRPGPVIGRTVDTIPVGVQVPRPNLAQLLQGPLAVVVFCALGLALVRWIPTWLVVVPTLVAFLYQFTIWGIWSGTTVSALNWWLPISSGVVAGEWVGCSSRSPVCLLEHGGFDQTTPWWHLTYLIALAAVLVAVALLRHRRDRAAWTFFGVSLAAVAGLAVAQAIVYQQYTPLNGG
jgi:hypothetical protein